MSIPLVEPPSSREPGTQVPTENVTEIRPLSPKSIEELQEGTRQDIAHRLIFAYLILLAVTIAVPVVSLWMPHVGANGFSVTDARDLMLAMSGTLSGLVGIIGFVMGYYFKALDTTAATRMPRRTSKRN